MIFSRNHDGRMIGFDEKYRHSGFEDVFAIDVCRRR
jgi:hypothetical protein